MCAKLSKLTSINIALTVQLCLLECADDSAGFRWTMSLGSSVYLVSNVSVWQKNILGTAPIFEFR